VELLVDGPVAALGADVALVKPYLAKPLLVEGMPH